MKRIPSNLGKTLIASAAIALTAAACGSDNSQNSSSSAGAGSGAIVAVASVDGSSVLKGADGHTLYSANVEKGGKIRCVDSCTSFWLPVMATSAQAKAVGTGLSSQLTVVKRPDGQTQLAYKGLPLYSFSAEGAGELKGDGFTDDFQGTHFVWSAARTDGSVAAPKTSGSPAYGGGGRYGY